MEDVFYLKTISFNSNGGSSVPQQKLMMGETAVRPADPVKEGSIFASWYADNNTFAQEWDFSASPEDNVTLYAKWLIYEPEDGDISFTIDVENIINRDIIFDNTAIVLSRSAAGGNPKSGEISITHSGAASSIRWYYDNAQIGTGSSITLAVSNNPTENGYSSPYNIIKKHLLTVVVTIGGVDYSGNIEFEVRQ